MSLRPIALIVGCLSSFPFAAHSAAISFSEAWQLLQNENNSLAAQRANVDRYQHLENATDNLNLPSVTIGANYTRLDTDVTLSLIHI